MADLRTQKYQDLMLEYAYEEGEDLLFLEEYGLDSCVPGICMNEGCGYTAEYEPDQGAGYCEECGTNTVCSALLLAGIL